jgi:ABC-2 type transport system permease protein
MKALAVARVNLKRYFREKSAIFMVFVLPMMIVLLLGSMAGGAGTPEVGFVGPDGDVLADELFALIDEADGVEATRFETGEDAIRQVERGSLQAALVLPDGYEATLRTGADVQIRLVVRAEQQDQGLIGIIDTAITRQATLLRTARFAEMLEPGRFDEALAAAAEVQAQLPEVTVEASLAGEPFSLATLGQFDIYAQGMLVLFMFMTTLAGAVNLVQSRQLGVARRMYSTPTTIGAMLGGEALGRFAIALIQGAFVFLGTWLVFGVDWGSPVGAVLTIVVFAAVASAAAMLLGSLVSNDRQADGIATAVGLGLAALGGCMFPLPVLELLSETVYQVAHITPHAWALESFISLVAEDGGLADIAGFLGILLVYALVLFLLAGWRLSRVLVR